MIRRSFFRMFGGMFGLGAAAAAPAVVQAANLEDKTSCTLEDPDCDKHPEYCERHSTFPADMAGAKRDVVSLKLVLPRLMDEKGSTVHYERRYCMACMCELLEKQGLQRLRVPKPGNYEPEKNLYGLMPRKI